MKTIKTESGIIPKLMLLIWSFFLQSMCLRISLSLSAVSRDEWGESWGRGGRRKWLSVNVCHPERRAAHRVCHHACPDHLLWTDPAWIAEDLNTRTISAPGLNPETDFSMSQLCWLVLKHLPSWTRSWHKLKCFGQSLGSK